MVIKVVTTIKTLVIVVINQLSYLGGPTLYNIINVNVLRLKLSSGERRERFGAFGLFIFRNEERFGVTRSFPTI